MGQEQDKGHGEGPGREGIQRSGSEVWLLDWSLDSASLSGGLWENPNLTVRAPAHGTGGGAGLMLGGGAGDTHQG